MSVRARLTVWYAATLALVLLAFAAAAVALLQRRLAAALDAQLAEDKEVAEQLLRRDPDGRIVLQTTGHGVTVGFSLAVQDDDGTVLLVVPEPAPPWTRELRTSWRQFRTVGGGDATRVLSDPEFIDGQTVMLHVARSEAPLREQVRELMLVSLLLLPLGVLIAAAGGLFLARKALQPVARMAEQARRVTAERLGERMPIVNPRDEFGRLAGTFNETLARLERSFTLLRQFTADASHELRTPLTALRSVGEVGLRTEHDAAGCREVIASMLEEVDRLTCLIDTLLLLARSDQGSLPWSPSAVSLGELAREVVGSLAVLAEEKRLQVTVTAAEVSVPGDRTLLRQVLINLVHNAIQHSEAGAAIAIDVAAAPDLAQVSVRDTGPGIAPEHRPRVFERFFRGDQARSRQRGGTGLGLAVARSIVELHGGTIDLVEHVGPGALFRVKLPREQRKRSLGTD